MRLQGFAPSCRVSSPATFRSVRTGNALGVPSSRLLPLDGAATPFGVRCPPAVTRATRATRRSREPGADPASRLCSPRESVTIERGLAARSLDAPLRFCALGRSGNALRPKALPSRTFQPSRSPGAAAGPSGYRSARRCWRSLAGAATLLRFLHLLFPRASNPRRPDLTATGPVTLPCRDPV